MTRMAGLLAARVLAATGLGGAGPARVDLIEVWIGPRGEAPQIVHHRDLSGPVGERG